MEKDNDREEDQVSEETIEIHEEVVVEVDGEVIKVKPTFIARLFRRLTGE